MSLQKIIEQVESSLTWAISKKYITQGDEEITSDPWSRTHTITIPHDGHRDIEYLHELAHATLAERHHLLSTAIFASGTPVDALHSLAAPIRTASDWYADNLLMQWVPDLEQQEIMEHLGYCIPLRPEDADMFYGGGLFLAQGVYYCGRSINEAPRYSAIARLLLQVDPGTPSVTSKRDLVNSLAALTCRHRIDQDHEDGFDVWIVNERSRSDEKNY